MSIETNKQMVYRIADSITCLFAYSNMFICNNDIDVLLEYINKELDTDIDDMVEAEWLKTAICEYLQACKD